MKRYFFILLLNFLAAGCLSSLSLFHRKDFSFPEEIYNRVYSNYKQVRTFRGKGIILVNSVDGKFEANINTTISVKDTLCKVEFDGALGINIATFLILGKKFKLLDEREGILYLGSVDKLNLEDITYIDIPFSDLISLFTGRCNFDKSFYKNRKKVRTNAEFFSLSLIQGEFKLEYFIDQSTGIVKNFTKYKNNKLIYKKDFSNFIRINNAVLPRKTRYTVRNEKGKILTKVTIVYRMQDVNKELNYENFEIEIPENVQVKLLK